MTNLPEYISPVAQAASGLLATALRGVAPPPSADGRPPDLSPLLTAIARALRGPATRRDSPPAQTRAVSGADLGPSRDPGPSARRPSPPGDGPAVAGPETRAPLAEASLPSRGSGSQASTQDHRPSRPGTPAHAPSRADESAPAPTRAPGSPPEALAVEPLRIARADLAPAGSRSPREPVSGAPRLPGEAPARLQGPSPGPATSGDTPPPSAAPRSGGGDLPPVVRAAASRRLEVDVTVRAATDGLAAALAESDEVRETVCRILREAVGDEV